MPISLLDTNAKAHLLRAIENNRCVLFVGAGFSRDSANKLGIRMPNSQELARLLWDWAELKGPYDGSGLGIVFEAALAKKRPKELREFLENQLLTSSIEKWYHIVPRVHWYRIYGTNADDVLERAYRECRAETALHPISAPRMDFQERDQFLRQIQYVKLNGSLPGEPHELTFGTLQSAGRAGLHDEWYHHFVRDYVFNPTIFVGSELEEPLFWEAISARGRRGANPEERPRSYLVSPSISSAKEAFLDAMSISHVPATGEQFFRWLEKEYTFPDRLQTLGRISPEAAEVLSRHGVNTRTRDALTDFLGVFARVMVPKVPGGRPKVFLYGAPPTWDDIALEYDSPREINQAILTTAKDALANDKGLVVLAVLGEGGSGKSTILKRVAFSLRQDGNEVFFADGATRPDIAAVKTAIASFDRRVLLFVDNAQLFGKVLPELLTALSQLPRPPLVVFAARYVQFEQTIRTLLGPRPLDVFEVPNLSDTDIRELLATLERHSTLGHLARLTPDERVYEFKSLAKQQILVAMREAIEGDHFDVIIRSEFDELTEYEQKILFLCAALATSELVDLTENQWFDCSEVDPATTLAILRHALKGMVFRDDAHRLVTARHPFIAEFILDRVAGKGDVMEAYRRVLMTLSRDIYPGAGRRHRSWRLFTRLIDHQQVYERFGSDIDRARGVYELAASAYRNDGHFWLQYANLEIDHGLPELARPHLANAEGLLGETALVLTTRAHMTLREALTARSYDEAFTMRRDAEDILRSQMEAKRDDEYPYHVYLTHVLAWIRTWEHENRERKRDQLAALLEVARDAHERMPTNRKLKSLVAVIEREYLATAIARRSHTDENVSNTTEL